VRLFDRREEIGCAYIALALVAVFVITLLASFHTWPVVLSYWPYGVPFAAGWFLAACIHGEGD
jgi:hypothetical protein